MHAEGIMNKIALLESGGYIIVVSPSYLYMPATKKGNRPRILKAAKPESGHTAYEKLYKAIRN